MAATSCVSQCDICLAQEVYLHRDNSDVELYTHSGNGVCKAYCLSSE